jgi:SAM-dependent methyltransferase
MKQRILARIRHTKYVLRWKVFPLRHGNWVAWRRFWGDYEHYRQLAPADRRPNLKHLLPYLDDATAETAVEPIYFYQDAWAFEKIVHRCPAFHVDVGSHHKYVALLSKVVPVTMVDIRPLSLPLESLHFQEGSILDMPFEDGSVPSVSSLCVIEHIGLGRYGDPIDPYGSEKAIQELKRIVQPGGDLYVSLPIEERNQIYFNGQRTFTEEYLFSLFEPFQVAECRYIYGQSFGEQRQTGFGVGCYHLKSPAAAGAGEEIRRYAC